MPLNKRTPWFIAALVTLGLTLACADHSASAPQQTHTLGAVGTDVPSFWVRPGYRVTLAASGLEEARFMEFGEPGILYLSRPEHGDILTLKKQGDTYKEVATFTSGHRQVHGMQYVGGWLWFTESGAVFKARDKDGDGKADEEVTIVKDLPHGGHWWRPILVVKDGFYTGIGDPGNITDQTNTDREKIWKYSMDGSSRSLFISGIRNTEKLLLRPGTDEVWGADHGSDNFGAKFGENPKIKNQPVTDWNPPCEFNHYVQGSFYGHPFIVGNRVPRPEYQDRPDILELAAKTIVPAWNFGPHWAPNGWDFLKTEGLGAEYKGDALVALHGSWNSVEKVGYRVERVLFDKVTEVPYGGQMLVGTLKGQQVLGRPVDVIEEPDGNVLFSDDQNNAIYRISKVK